MLPLFRAGSISEQQAKAIVTLLAKTKFTNDAMLDLVGYIQIADTRGLFLKGAATPLITPTQLESFNNAIGFGNVAKISFVSPKTGLIYVPLKYLAIKEFVANADIHVFEISISTLNTIGSLKVGVYASDKNRLVLYNGVSHNKRTRAIVHEVTHAIQDWSDVVTIHKYAEADAYIAGGVVDHILGAEPDKTDILFWTAYKAAQLVMDGKARSINDKWKSAYNLVVQAVEKSPDYKTIAKAQWSMAETGGEEKKRMDLILATLVQKAKQAQEFGEWVTQAYEMTELSLNLGDGRGQAAAA